MGADRQQVFVEAIQDEPGLAIWVVCRSGLFGSGCTVDTLSCWLADHADECLAGCTDGRGDAGDLKAWGELAAESVTVARAACAERLEPGRPVQNNAASPMCEDPAYLLGLLHNVAAWLTKASTGSSTADAECYPAELAPVVRELESSQEACSAAMRVRDAQLKLEGRARKPPGRREILRRWEHPEHSDLAAALPAIASLRCDLWALQSKFGEELERAKLRSLREFAYGASHEINNPLANIATRAQTLLHDELDPERRRKLATICTQAFRAHEMISDMMLFAKPPELSIQPIDVAELLQTIVSELKPLADEQGTALKMKLAGSIGVLEGDRTQLAVAVKSLVQNALEAIATGGQIEIMANEERVSDSRWVEFTVADSGPGIPAVARPHLFDPFYSGREAGRGLGFGLSKCWRIAELHGGSVAVTSAPEHGAQFTIRLPAEQPTCPQIRSAG
jgi:signal transduction histidine kinase